MSSEGGPGGIRVRRAVSVAIRPGPGERERVLTVRRPLDDPDLPGVWGLPAASLRPGEAPEAAALRAGREKLGVSLGGLARCASGSRGREGYRLEMDLFEGEIVAGAPRVPQPTEGVTQYVEWRWGRPEDLAPGAAAGSLCCRLFLGGSHATDDATDDAPGAG